LIAVSVDTTAGMLERPRAGLPDAESGEWRGTPFDVLAGLALRVPWCWPALLTLALGFFRVNNPELWRDELASWSSAARPVAEMFSTARRTGATQLPYYLLLHYWIAVFGDSMFAMRSLSVLAASGTAACVALAGRRLAGAGAGLTAGLLFALIPSVSRFAQEVRFYSLEALAGTVATLLLLRALDQPRPRRWAAYAVSLALLGYLDIVALAVVTGHVAAVALRWWRDRDLRLAAFAPAVLAGIAACLPLLRLGSAQASSQVGWIPRPGADLSAVNFYFRNLFYSTSVAAVVIMLAVIALGVAWRAASVAAVIAVLPVAAVWLVSQGAISYFFPRYLLLTVSMWAILAAIAICSFDLRLAAALVLAVAVFGAGDQEVIREPGAHSWAAYPVSGGDAYLDYAGAAGYIADDARPGDGIIYLAGGSAWQMTGYGVRYYLAADLPHGPVPRPLLVRQVAGQPAGLYLGSCARSGGCPARPTQIWIIAERKTKDPFRIMPLAMRAVLAPHYRLARGTDRYGFGVWMLART
jgi:mannosyltransferase